MSSKFPPTSEQQAVITAVAAKSGKSLMCQAGAGCAKTTTAVMSMDGWRDRFLGIAFNKRNADEMVKVMPSNGTNKTYNGVGHGAFMRGRGFRNVKLDDKKQGKVISEVARRNKTELSREQWEYARTLLREAQIQGLVPEPYSKSYGTLVPNSKDGWKTLASDHAIPSDDFDLIWEVAKEALVENIKLAFQGIISFDDQVYCSVMLGGAFTKYPFIFVDEYQDSNLLNIKMVEKSLEPGGRLFIVGDMCQSIYAFRGAAKDAAEQFKGLRPEWLDLPLMTSFRVPKVVAERQTDHVPLFRAHESNTEGQLLAASETEGWNWPNTIAKFPDPDAGIAILCRNNAPIISMAFKLIRQGVGCHVLGRDVSKGLKALTNKLVPDDDTKADIIVGKVDEWLRDEIQKARFSDEDAAVDKFTDKAESIKAILVSAECQDAGQLRRQIDALFSRDSGLVTLSTIHKSKGMEWKQVIHLNHDLVPHPRAIKVGGRALEQELNLKYVAETRTKHTLMFAPLTSFS